MTPLQRWTPPDGHPILLTQLLEILRDTNLESAFFLLVEKGVPKLNKLVDILPADQTICLRMTEVVDAPAHIAQIVDYPDWGSNKTRVLAYWATRPEAWELDAIIQRFKTRPTFKAGDTVLVIDRRTNTVVVPKTTIKHIEPPTSEDAYPTASLDVGLRVSTKCLRHQHNEN